MNDMFVRINEMWRRFFDLPMSDEYLDLKLREVHESGRQNAGHLGERGIDALRVTKHCCTIFWDIDDPRRQPDQSRTVNSREDCEKWRKECQAKGIRKLLDGAC